MRDMISCVVSMLRGGMVGLLLLVFVACGGKKQDQVLISVTIESSPESGASVLMAGYDQGTTPVTIDGITPGEYEVVLRLDRYKRKIEPVTVTQEPHQTFTIEMEPIVGYLTIHSNPLDAEVYIGEELIGKTPIIRKSLQVGPYTYEIRHPDYYSVTNSFVMEDGFNLEFSHELKPLESQLSIFSRPSSARIWLNNIAQAPKTPATVTLRPGRYLVSVYSDGYVQADTIVELEANTQQTVQLEMKPGNVPQGMVLIPGGTFIMGSNDHAPDERPAREVFVKAFFIDRFEVTNQAFKQIFPDHKFLEGQENYPALGISWNRALKYCEAVGKRLPTEAEWEKAARHPDNRLYPWGDIFNPRLCNTSEARIGAATRVGFFYEAVSYYGCLDLAGNAYEWTADWYEAYPGNQYVTKDYGQIFRVLRGGSFLTDSFEARTMARHFDRMDSDRRDYGCRCVQSAPE